MFGRHPPASTTPSKVIHDDPVFCFSPMLIVVILSFNLFRSVNIVINLFLSTGISDFSVIVH